MKRNFIAIIAIATVAFTMSCKSGGMSEETKTRLANFETDWDASKTTMGDWGKTMETRMDAMNKKMDESMPMHIDVDIKKKDKMEMLTTDDSMTMMCNMIKMEMEAMKAIYNASMDSVKAQSDQYAQWKKISIEAKDEEATIAGIDQWTAKLAANKTMMEEWNAQLTQMEENCNSVCNMMVGKEDHAGHSHK